MAAAPSQTTKQFEIFYQGAAGIIMLSNGIVDSSENTLRSYFTPIKSAISLSYSIKVAVVAYFTNGSEILHALAQNEYAGADQIF